MARMHLAMGVPYFIDRDFTELADARGLQARRHPCAVVPGSTAVERGWVGGLGHRAHTLPVMFSACQAGARAICLQGLA